VSFPNRALPNTKYETPNTNLQTKFGNLSMHEMGIALQIVEIVTASLPADLGNARVAQVNLKIGKFAAVVPESLRFCFDAVVEDTPLAGAKLAIEEMPVVAKCKDCNAQWTIDEPVFICKTCQSGSLEILSGRELDIESIEVVEEVKNDSG
jgi:hydrogenase nickel incorporation protein HypA/HybF